MTSHDFEFTSIEGKPLLLSEWRGKPVLVVDTAARCQVTPRFPGLQQLLERFRGKAMKTRIDEIGADIYRVSTF